MEQFEDNLTAAEVVITDEDRKAVAAIVRPGTHVSPYYEAEFAPHPSSVSGAATPASALKGGRSGRAGW